MFSDFLSLSLSLSLSLTPACQPSQKASDEDDDVTSDNVEQRSSILCNICMYVFYMRLYQF
jgi:hypothetical protein